MKKHTAYISALLGITMLLGSCTNILSPPEVREAVPAGKGRLAIQVEDGVRTALPSGTFDRYVLGFEYTGGPEGYAHGEVDWTNGGTVDLEAGTWTITLNAYSGTVLSGTGSEVVSVNEGTTTLVTLRVGTMNTGSGITGTLKYTVSYPLPANPFDPSPYDEQKLYVYDMTDNALVGGYPVTVINGQETPLSLPAGVYRVRVVVENINTNTTASASIVAHIYGNMTTPVVFDFELDDFTARMPLTVTADLTVPYGVEVEERVVYVYEDRGCTSEYGLDNRVIGDDSLKGCGEAAVTLFIPSTYTEVYLRQEIKVGGLIYEGEVQTVEIDNPGQPVSAESLSDIYYKVDIDPSIVHGTVKATLTETSPAGEDISIARENTTVTLTVEPDTNSVLKNGSLTYSIEGSPTLINETGGVYSFSMPDADVTVTAEFIQFVRYVKTTGTETRDGSSWENASNDIQKMMDELAALSLDPGYSGPYVVKLGAGTYKPKYKPMIPASATDPYERIDGGRDNSFMLRPKVQVWGGYPADGGDETDEATREIRFGEYGGVVSAYKAILSGDLDNSGGDPDTNDAYHVVKAVDIPANSGTVLDGLTISGGNADEYGGGMYNTNASPKLTRVTISGNKAQNDYPNGSGGGMYNGNGSSPELKYVTISGNRANYGGGMYNASSSPKLDHVEIYDNHVTDKGGGMYNDNSSPELTDVKIYENEVFIRSGSGGGGGIYNSGSSPTLAYVEIYENVAYLDGGSSSGGGMYNDNSSPVLTNVTISGNLADIDGGGIYNVNGSTPVLTNVTIGGDSSADSNKAQNGGGVYVAGGSFTMSGGTITGNSAAARGGGMYNDGATLDLSDVTISNNAVTAGTDPDHGGGGIYNTGSATSGTLTNVRISNNAANSDDNAMTSGLGGGIYNNDISSSLSLEDVTISGNTATSYGGGMFNNNSSPALTDVIIRGANTSGYYGGGMVNIDSSPVMNRGEISGNIAAGYGGGIANGSTGSTGSSSPVLTDVTISGNFANNGRGGGMWNGNGSSPILKDVTISGNTAVGSGGYHYSNNGGGGMYNVNGSSPILDGVIISDNIVTITFNDTQGDNNGGGGMYNADGSSPTLDDVTISGNTVTITITASGAGSNNGGGGMYNGNSSPVMSNVEISGNTVTITGAGTGSGGGGVYVAAGTFAMTSGTISGNKAATSDGGGVYVAGGTFTKTGGTIYGDTDTTHTSGNNENIAVSGNGHAVYVHSGPLKRNATAGTGVALDSTKPGILNGWEDFTSTGISAAIADPALAGGGTLVLPAGTYFMETDPVAIDKNITITTEPGATVILERKTGFTGDMIKVTSGGLTLQAAGTGGSLTLDGKDVIGVTGSLVRVEGGNLTMHEGVTLRKNKNSSSSAAGGGVYFIGGGTFTMDGGTISGNEAVYNGGGVYVAGTGSFIMSGNAAVSNNKVTNLVTSVGGGVMVGGGSFTMNGGTIGANSAAGEEGGGGVYVEVNATFNMNGGSISGNRATLASASDPTRGVVGGGGVSVAAGGNFAKTGGTIYGDNASDTDKNTAASGIGHAVYVDSWGQRRNSTAGTEDDLDSATFSLDHWDATSNYIQYEIGKNDIPLGGTGPIVLPAGTYDMYNQVVASRKSIIITTNPDENVILERNSSFKGDMIKVVHESTYGGSLTLQADTGGSLTLDGANVTGVTGSLVRVESLGVLQMETGVTLRNNKSSGDGGGVHVTGDGATFNMNEGTISGNEAANGGGVYVNVSGSGQFFMTGAGLGIISNNYARESGGGVYVGSGIFIKDQNSVILGDVDNSYDAGNEQNTAFSGEGHAVYLYDATTPKKRNNDALQGITLDSGSPGNWDPDP